MEVKKKAIRPLHTITPFSIQHFPVHLIVVFKIKEKKITARHSSAGTHINKIRQKYRQNQLSFLNYEDGTCEWGEERI